ncbi:MAG: hypothetical protein MJ191_02670 [Clostridium sp.]|nr:hypothetical protein [Clostridium sp.]
MLKQKIDYVDTLKKNDAEKVIQATLVKEKANSNSIKDSVPINIINNISITDDEAIEIINLIKSSIKNSIKNDSNYDDYNNYNNNINREYSNKEYSNFYNDHSKGYNEHVISKEIIKESIFNQTGREILLTDDEAKSLNVIINKEVIKDKDISFVKNLFKNIEDKQQIVHKDIENNYINKNIKDIKKDIVDIRKDIVDIRNNLSKNVSKKSEGAKEVIRNIISNLKEGNENSSQILNIMKNNINDLKLFNKINNQYYCLDVPVNFKENEYPCKLIIKDDRKDGKVIDSSNFKVAISVKTVNLGTVDALLDVRNKNIYLKLKCDKNVMNLFIMEKDRIKDILESSGFISKIEVIERIEELELSSCREFFNDNNIATVDIKV